MVSMQSHKVRSDKLDMHCFKEFVLDIVAIKPITGCDLIRYTE